jgi:hypothetical protein|tara:strand:+ start:862 stop:1572 length:711 start_codon:yes stop_codon:yes gene_type:complete
MKSINHLEMQNYISEKISIDSFAAKLGKDEDVSVLKFQSNNKTVAEDLVNYIETGCNFILDADMSPAKNEQGLYNIFVEIERNEDLPKKIIEVIRDIEQVSGMLPWQFSFYKNENFYQLTDDNLNTIIPTSPSQYTLLTDDTIEEDIKQFFESASIVTKRIKGKKLILKKAFTSHEMIIESFNRDVKGTYKIDRESSEQASYLSHWLGSTYSVVKVDDLFKITNGTKSIVAKLKEF